jgi:hypothetical protein
VPSVRRQCCIAHDGGDRTLRAHCKKSAEHLPLPSGNDAYESLHLLTVLPTLAPIRIDAPRCTVASRFPVPTFRLRDSLSECYITGRCLPAMTPRVLVMGDQVRTEENFFRRTVTINSFTGRSLSARLQGSFRFFSRSHTRIVIVRLTVSYSTFVESDTGLPCSAEMT